MSRNHKGPRQPGGGKQTAGPRGRGHGRDRDEQLNQRSKERSKERSNPRQSDLRVKHAPKGARHASARHPEVRAQRAIASRPWATCALQFGCRVNPTSVGDGPGAHGRSSFEGGRSLPSGRPLAGPVGPPPQDDGSTPPLLRIFTYCIIVAALGVEPLHAAETVTGRWALDPSSCARFFGTAGQSPLIVSDSSLRWSADACRIERSYKTGDTVHIQALCWGDGGERSIPVSLRPHAGRLAVTWDRGPRGELRRCQ